MKDAIRRVAKLEGQPHPSPRQSRLSRAMDSLSVDERLLLADTPCDENGYVAAPERLEAINPALAKVDAFNG